MHIVLMIDFEHLSIDHIVGSIEPFEFIINVNIEGCVKGCLMFPRCVIVVSIDPEVQSEFLDLLR